MSTLSRTVREGRDTNVAADDWPFQIGVGTGDAQPDVGCQNYKQKELVILDIISNDGVAAVIKSVSERGGRLN